jgi:AraC-like DNA-binding protein
MQNATLHPLTRERRWEPLSAAERKARLARRQAWLEKVDMVETFNSLFDLLPDLYVFVKNQKSEIMFFSRSILETFGVTDEAAVIGLTDFDLTPAEMSRGYREQDAMVLAGGRAILNHRELWFDSQGLPDWFVVNKLPLRSKTGKIVGIIGFLQRCHVSEHLLPSLPTVAKAAALLRERYPEPMRIKELAQRAGVSPRQLERQFKAIFHVGPHQFLAKTRVQAAARLLRETRRGLAEIAAACGFCDQSALTRTFRQHVGITPSEFRRRCPAPAGLE